MPDNDKIERCPCGGEMIWYPTPGMYACKNSSGCPYLYMIPMHSHPLGYIRRVHNRNCKLVRLGALVEKVIEKPPQCVVDEKEYLTDQEILVAHKYYNWAYLDIIDRLTLPEQNDSEVKDGGK